MYVHCTSYIVHGTCLCICMIKSKYRKYQENLLLFLQLLLIIVLGIDEIADFTHTTGNTPFSSKSFFF